MKVNRLALLIALALAGAGSSRAHEAGAAPDPRIDRANALLEDEARHPEAIGIYRAVLADDPAAAEARLWLARVLAWQQRYDEALVEFDRLLIDAPSDELRVEYGEVLSWAGRNDRAERVLRAILDGDPTNARAARGLARIYRWSGRRVAADAAYARALALEEDAEARSEWNELRADSRPKLESASSWLSDSDDFERGRWAAAGELHLDLHTALSVEVAYLRAEGRVEDPVTGARLRQDADGSELSLAVERRLDDRWRVHLGLGHRRWSGARDHWVGRGKLEFAPNEHTSLDLSARYGDALEATDSYLVVADGLRIGQSTLSLWKGLGPRLELYGAVSGGWLSDGNSRYAGTLSVSVRPWSRHDLRIELSGSGLSYLERSPRYYDPKLDIEGLALARYRKALPLDLGLDFTLAAGLGRTREVGAANTGPAVRTAAALSWKRSGWSVVLQGAYARSQRGASYEVRRLSLDISRSF